MAMKRSAPEATPTPAAAGFAPKGAACFDPKAYFKQFAAQAQQPAFMGAVPVATAAAPAAAAGAGEQKSEVHTQVEAASAVRCSAICKEKGQNFTTTVALAALKTMATKSSWKLREELLKQKDVKLLCKRVLELVKKPPPAWSVETLSDATWCLMRFGEEVMGDAKSKDIVFAPMIKSLTGANGTQWQADTAAKVLWSLARAEVIVNHKKLVSQVVGELVRDLGRRVNEPSHEALMNLLWALTKARKYVRSSEHSAVAIALNGLNAHKTMHLEENDEIFFQYASKRIINEVETIDVKLLAECIITQSEIGIRDEPLFKAICPMIMKKQKDLREDKMAKVIKAYTRFMIPLTDAPQGFRTMAVVQKGDFIRPSEKPAKKGRKTYDHPCALYEKTQVHSRG